MPPGSTHIGLYERLPSGDLIYIGTPAGVGAVVLGDEIEVTIAGIEPLKVTVGEKEAYFR